MSGRPNHTDSGPVRVFLVDDSAVVRLVLRRALRSDPDLTIVGEATSGPEALRRIPDVAPDIVLMDVLMQGMDGIETARTLMQTSPRPVLVVSDLAERDENLSFRALEAGALDVIRKPSAEALEDPTTRARLCRKVRLLAEVPVVTRYRRRARSRPRPASPAKPPDVARPADVSCVAIGASTGGPPALLRILRELPAPGPWPVLIVQHMSEGFLGGMCRWLAGVTGHQIELARDGARLEPGVVLVAPDAHHLEIRDGRSVLVDRLPVSGHRPSVDVLFESLAQSTGAQEVLAILLTGMGADGAHGLERLRRAGAITYAQDEASSVVYGMPKAAADRGAAQEILSLDAIAQRLRTLAARTGRRTA